MIIAQISDLHIKRRGHVLNHMPHVAGPLRKTLTTINGLARRPDCIIATGDLTETGHRDEYRKLRFLLSITDIPVYLLPGNHDNRDAMRSAFPDHAYLGDTGPVQYVIEGALLRVIALDSSEPFHRGGYLDAARLAFLEEQLRRAPRTPTIVALHHPPFATGVPAFDSQYFYGRDELAGIIRAHKQVQRVASGHVHQVFRKPWNGALGVSAPSTAPTLVLRPDGRGIFLEPGGFLLHYFDWNAGIASELVRTSTEAVALSA